jgi:hypothetical protein
MYLNTCALKYKYTSSNAGILEYWNTGILEYWNTGILEYWNTRVHTLEYIDLAIFISVNFKQNYILKTFIAIAKPRKGHKM